METVEVKLKTLQNYRKIGRRALIAGFTLVTIMLFHVLVDFFYHT